MNTPFTTHQLEDSALPSIFEILMRDQLSEGLRPAFMELLTSSARSRDPSSILSRLPAFGDELFLFVDMCLQVRLFFKYDGTFAENFYGLKRMKRINSTTFRPLSKREKLFTLLVVTMTPYLRTKISKYYQFVCDLDPLERTESQQLWMKYYPYFDAFLEGTHFCFQILFLFGFSQFDNLMNFLLGQNTRRVEIEDLHRWKKWEENWRTSYPRLSFFGKMIFGIRRILFMSSSIIEIAILSLLFGFRLVTWFMSEEDRLISNKNMPVPPPPPVYPKHRDGLRVPSGTNVCPICRRSLKNGACLPSGYVFCYGCVFAYVQQHERCPVTFMPCSHLQIRKVYE